MHTTDEAKQNEYAVIIRNLLRAYLCKGCRAHYTLLLLAKQRAIVPHGVWLAKVGNVVRGIPCIPLAAVAHPCRQLLRKVNLLSGNCKTAKRTTAQK
jgi:hypothetical protein